MKRVVGCICLVLAVAGCRYSHEIPSGNERSDLGIGSITNRTLENELTPVIRREITRQLAAKAPLNIIEARPGKPTLSGVITSYSRDSLRSDNFARSAEFRLTIAIEFTMRDGDNRELWRKTLTGEETFAAGAGAELAAQRDAVNDMVIKLIHALFPVW